MLNYSWSKDYSVNDPMIDDHHQNLLKIFSKVSDLLSEKEKGEELRHLMKELQFYTIFHFTEEEKRMSAANYSRLEQHMMEHKSFIEELEKSRARLDENPDEVAEDLFLFLNHWLLDHIQKEDMLYKDQI